jgi:hypothetical protein
MTVNSVRRMTNSTLFDPLSASSAINSSDSTTINTNNNFYASVDTDLAALFVSTMSINEKLELTDNQPFDEVFLSSVNDLVSDSESSAMGPPPGFEHLRFDSTLSNHLMCPTSIDETTNTSLVSRTSPSDVINFSQLLPSTLVGESFAFFLLRKRKETCRNDISIV